MGFQSRSLTELALRNMVYSWPETDTVTEPVRVIRPYPPRCDPQAAIRFSVMRLLPPVPQSAVAMGHAAKTPVHPLRSHHEFQRGRMLKRGSLGTRSGHGNVVGAGRCLRRKLAAARLHTEHCGKRKSCNPYNE